MMGSLGVAKVVRSSSDPVVIELTRLENNLREKERELGAAHCEIKALKVTELLKDKAVVELSNELKKLESKLRNTEKHVEDKSLEIKKVLNEKKEALAAQFAAEATLRRVYANQKDEESLPVEAIIAPYESNIRKYKNEIASMQEDKKALERLTKSKEVALVEAERILHSAQEQALIVENLQNQNLELKRQIEICQEENRLLEKANRQKVVEVEKLGQTIRELEESILAGGAVANVVRDFQRQVSELNEEKKTLERELARMKVSASRMATVAANEWKDEGDKVMPFKQWMEERKFLQGEIQRLRDKFSISERTIKAETQLRDKFKLRLKILEDGLKGASSLTIKGAEKSDQVKGFRYFSGTPRKRSTSQPRASVAGTRTSIQQQPDTASFVEPSRKIVRIDSLTKKSSAGENLVRKNLWAPRSKFFDDCEKENTEGKLNSDGHFDVISPGKEEVSKEVKASGNYDSKSLTNGNLGDGNEDSVSGFLYDRLQKEVIYSRKLLEQKDGALGAKDDEIKLLQRKIDALTMAMELEFKKMRREATAREKKIMLNSGDNKQKFKTTNSFKRSVQSLKTGT